MTLPVENPYQSPSAVASTKAGWVNRIVWCNIVLLAPIALSLYHTFWFSIPFLFIFTAVSYGGFFATTVVMSLRKRRFVAILLWAIAASSFSGCLSGFVFGVKEVLDHVSDMQNSPVTSWLSSYAVRQSIARAIGGTIMGAVIGVPLGAFLSLFRKRAAPNRI